MARRCYRVSAWRLPGRLLAGLALLLVAITARGATYTARPVPFSWDDPTGHAAVRWTGTAGLRNECRGGSAPPDDAISQEIPIGFTFRFGNTGFTSVRIMSNGRLQFGNRYCGYGTQRIGPPRTYPYPYPNGNLNATMRGLGADWDPSAGGRVTYATLGSGASQRFVVTWSDVPEWSRGGGAGKLNMQMVLHVDGSFEYRYGTLDYRTGGHPQAGWQISRSDYALFSYRTVASLQHTAIRWSIPRPVAYYAMDESAWNGTPGEVTDGSGNALNGTTRGSARPLPAKVCNGADLNGTGSRLTDYIEIPDDRRLDFPDEMSAMAWIFPRRIPRSGMMTILSKGSNFQIHLNSSGRIYWWWKSRSGITRYFTSSARVPVNRWTHVAITYRNGRQVLYVNGRPSATRRWAGGMSTNNQPLFIGYDPPPDRGWVGKIDEVRLFDRALEAGQVRYWMNSTHTCTAVGCSLELPYALQNSRTRQRIELSGRTVVRDSPSNMLGTTDLRDRVRGNSCGTGRCLASGVPSTPFQVPRFPAIGSSTARNVAPGSTFALGSDGTREYRYIGLGARATLADSGNYAAYHIKTLNMGSESVWVLQGGHDYWVETLNAGPRIQIRVAPGTGTARLFVRRKLKLDQARINTSGTPDPAALILFSYDKLELKRTDLVGLVGTQDKMEIQEGSTITGAASASGKIEVSDSKVVYDASAVAGVDHRGLCQGTSVRRVQAYRITHDGHGINCLDEPVTVRALDSSGNPVAADGLSITLDTGTGHGTWSLQSGTGSLADTTPDDGLATYTWGSGETTATFLLQYRQGSRVTYITASDGTAGGSASPLPFDPSGFILSAAPLGNPPPNPTPPFPAQTAGTGFPVYLTAYGITATDPTCGVIEAYEGTKNLDFWTEARDPATQVVGLLVNGSAIGTAPGSATPVSVTFSGGQARVSARYKDVGRIALYARDPSVHDPNLPTGYLQGNSEFVSRPAGLEVTSIVAPADSTPSDCVHGTRANPAATGPAGGFFARAGAPFCVTVTALDSDGDPVPSFGKETSPEDVALTASLAPGCGAPCIHLPGLVTEEDFLVSGFSNGRATGRFSWGEVGIITLRPDIADGDYLGTGNVTGTSSGNVGRFSPWDFEVTLNNAPSFQPASSGFTYLEQPFGYHVAPSVTIRARNRRGTVTRNYDGAWWKLPDLSATYLPTPALPWNTSLDSTAATVSGFNCPVTDTCDGVSRVTFGGTFVINRQSAYIAPFDAAIDISFPVNDGDASYAGNPFTISAVAFDDGNAGTTTDSQMRSGRGVLGGTYGQENQALRLYFWAQYYDGNGFINNDLDTATRYTAGAGNPACRVVHGPVSCADVTVSGTAAHGQWFDLSPPGRTGTLEYTLAVDPWLQFDWNRDGNIDDDPSADVIFGIYRGDDRVIHWRENR